MIRVIVNPAAGKRRRVDLPALVRASGLAADCIATEHPGHAETLARDAAAAGARIVVAAGGDGTVNEVARGLIGSDAALGIVPLGSGNGLARHLKLPLDPRGALSRLARPEVTRIDVGRINRRLFVCTAGIGFDAEVARRFALGRRRGLRGYAAATLRAYRAWRPAKVELGIGGRTIADDCWLLAFANASQYGNNARIAPHANLGDGLLDLCLIDRLPPWRAVRVVHAMMTGRMTDAGLAAYHTGAAITVRAARPMPFHVDGDYAGEADRFEVTLAPAALAVAT